MSSKRLPEPTSLEQNIGEITESKKITGKVNSYFNQLIRVLKSNFDSLDESIRDVIFTKHRREGMFYDTAVTGVSITDVDPEIFFHLISLVSNSTVDLRDATDPSCLGKTVIIKRNSGGAATLTVNNIEGGYNVPLPLQNDYVMLYCNGADWFIVAERR